MRLILYTIIILAFILFSGSADRVNGKNFGFQTTTKQFIDDTTSLFQIDGMNLHEDKLGQGVNPGFSNMNRIPRKVNSSAQDFSGDLNEIKATFEEKKREDAFEKKPAAESPHAVALIIYANEMDGPASPCSGSLITADWVLTAAHCLTAPDGYSISKILAYAGGYALEEAINGTLVEGSQLRSAKSILPHPKFINKEDYDIGLIQVNASFDITDTVKPVGISTEPWDHRGYRKCQITGFGMVQMGKKTPDNLVRKTHTLDVKKPCLCSLRLKKKYGAAAEARFLCARPREDYGVCLGDSGGGLLCDGQIRAVAMMLVQLNNLNQTCTAYHSNILFQNIECGSENTLSVFQDSCPFLSWVNSHVRLFNDSQISEQCVDRNFASQPLRVTNNLFLALALATVIFNKM